MNKYTNLSITDFESDDDLILHMIDLTDKFQETVTLYATSDYITYILSKLLYEYDLEVGILDVYGGIYDEEYGREYILEIDTHGLVSVCQAWGENDVIISDAVVDFVHQEHVTQELIDALLNRDERVVLFGVNEFECDHDCKNCHIHESELEASDVHVGIPAEKVIKDTDSKELKAQAARDAMKDYYDDIVADMSKKFTDVLDEMFAIVRKHFDK